jgi:phosphopantothenoylcysteine decarboxylase/phosphopantothenate--cysteine ligase
VLVTAGPTLEDIDPVRFIGNRSSGRMGFAVALEAQARGATVQLVAGPTAIEPPAVGEVVRVRSAREMHAAVMARAGDADVVVMAAAVADYAPAVVAESKIEKGGPLRIDLERTPDILADLGARRGDGQRPVLVGFAAQSGPVEGAARGKLEAKRVDLVVANDITEPGAGFDVETNHVALVSHEGVERLPLMSKREVAGLVLDRVEARLAGASALAAPRA